MKIKLMLLLLSGISMNYTFTSVISINTVDNATDKNIALKVNYHEVVEEGNKNSYSIVQSTPIAFIDAHKKRDVNFSLPQKFLTGDHNYIMLEIIDRSSKELIGVLEIYRNQGRPVLLMFNLRVGSELKYSERFEHELSQKESDTYSINIDLKGDELQDSELRISASMIPAITASSMPVSTASAIPVSAASEIPVSAASEIPVSQ